MSARAALAGLVLLGFVAPSPLRAEFVTFESGQVRPLALSPSGGRLFALNTPDGQLEIFAVMPFVSESCEADHPSGTTTVTLPPGVVQRYGPGLIAALGDAIGAA